MCIEGSLLSCLKLGYLPASKCLISKNTNTAASGGIQNNECMLVVHLVTPGLVWARKKTIVLWLLQVEFLSSLLTPALMWRKGIIGPIKKPPKSQDTVWVRLGPLISLVASTSRHLCEISTWQTLSSQAACAGKGGNPRWKCPSLLTDCRDLQRHGAPWSAWWDDQRP